MKHIIKQTHHMIELSCRTHSSGNGIGWSKLAMQGLQSWNSDLHRKTKTALK